MELATNVRKICFKGEEKSENFTGAKPRNKFQTNNTLFHFTVINYGGRYCFNGNDSCGNFQLGNGDCVPKQRLCNDWLITHEVRGHLRLWVNASYEFKESDHFK